MTTTMMHGTEDLRTLAAQKEKEWRDIEILRNHSLEAALKNLQKEHEDGQAKFQKLKDDFKYNLKLLSERDAELDKYDSVFRELKAQVVAKEREISDVKIRLADVEVELEREKVDKEQIHQHFQQRIWDKQMEMEKYCHEKDAEVSLERKEIEGFKRKLERQVIELEEELDTQRRELNTGFENAMKKREHEFRIQFDDLSGKLLAQELKVKLQQQEMENFKVEQLSREKELNNAEENCRHVEKELKQTRWKTDDELAVANAKLADMQNKVDNAETNLKRAREEYERKHAELDGRMKEKEIMVTKIKGGSVEKEREYLEEIQSLKAQLEEGNGEFRQLQWNKDDLEKELRAKIEQSKEEIIELTAQHERRERELLSTRSTTEREYVTLQDQVIHLKVQVEDRKRDIERYKRELRVSAEREATLERTKAQVELDWQRRCEELENKQFEKSEDLVKTLTKARDTTAANLKEKVRELEHKDQLIHVLSTERDQAFATLKQHGIMVDRNVEYDVRDIPRSAADEMISLQQQNETLKHVIKSMREEMEEVGTEAVSEEYVKQLETEIRDLKEKDREERKLNALDVLAGDKDGAKDIGGDNMLVRSHVDALNETIGQLRSEKVELSATVRKQQAQLLHLHSQIDQLSKSPKEQEATLADLQYKSGAMERRFQAEILGLKQQVSHSESQLKEAHSLADSYHKAVTEANAENTTLRQQLSSSRIQAAEGRPTVNFGAQELMIQQLEDEIQHLRKQLSGKSSGYESDKPIKGTNAELQAKLRQAVKHIKQLAKEKQQLIEVGNRLRSQLLQNQPVDFDESYKPLDSGSSELQSKIHNKLKDLEKMQYQLTKQELTIKKKEEPTKMGIPPAVVQSEEFESTEEEQPPKSILKKSSSSTVLSEPEHYVEKGTARSYGHNKPDVFLSSFSSAGGSSLQEVWQMLDQGDISAPTTPKLSPHRSNPFSAETLRGAGGGAATSERSLGVMGQPAAMVSRQPHQVPPRSPPTRQRTPPARGRGKTAGRGKFMARNWNEKC